MGSWAITTEAKPRRILVCPVCGQRISVMVKRGRPQIYCGPSCAEVARLRNALEAAEAVVRAEASRVDAFDYRTRAWHKARIDEHKSDK